MMFVGTIILFIIGALWIFAVVALLGKAMDVATDDEWLLATALGIAAVTVFALPFALFAQATDQNKHDDTVLCLAGHEERQKSSKVWVCDRWEAER